MVVKECVLKRPLLLVVPPEGTWLWCDVHRVRHFVRPSTIWSL